MKRIVSYIISISLISSLLYGMPVFAVDSESLRLEASEAIQYQYDAAVDDVALHNVDIKEMRTNVAKELSERDKYSSLTGEEQEVLRKEYKVRPDTMLACENAGYTINESILRAQMMQSVNGTVEQIDSMIENFGGMEEAQNQAKQFGNYKYCYQFMANHDNSTCVELLADGVPAETALRSFVGLFALNADLSAMVLCDDEMETDSVESDEIASISLSSEKVSADRMVFDETSETTAEKIAEDEKQELYPETFYWKDNAALHSSAYSEIEITEGELLENIVYTEEDKQIVDISAFSVDEQKVLTELVETYQMQTAVFLEAMQKYELSALELQKRMQVYLANYGAGLAPVGQGEPQKAAASATTSAFDDAVEFGCYGDAPFSYQERDTEEISLATGAVGYREKTTTLPGKNGLDLVIGAHYNTIESTTSINGFSATGVGGELTGNLGRKRRPVNPLAYFAAGWSFGFSFIEPNGFDRDWNDYYKPTLTLSNGEKSTLAWVDFYEYDDPEIRIMEHRFEDLTLMKDTSMLVGNVPSAYCLTYKDGKEEYFDSEGKLILIRNRFNNRITFAYSDYREIATGKTGEPVANCVKITDTTGRIVTIQRDDSKMTITYPDSSKTTYEFELVRHTDSGSDFFAINLKNIVDQVGDTTSFTYTQNDRSEYRLVQRKKSKYRPYYLLLTVTHPNGLFTEYQYRTRNVSYTDRHILESRKDTLNGKVFNQETYDYDATYYSRYANTILTLTNAEKSMEYHFYPNSDDPFYFEAKRLEKVIEFADTAKTQKLSETLYSEFYDYSEAQKVSKRVYDGNEYLETTERWEYDKYGDIIKSWSAKAEGNSSNTEYCTTITYDATYHYPIKKQYKRNSSSTVVEQYTPTTNRKAIAKAEVYENNVLKSKQEYTYPNVNTANPTSVLNYRTSSSEDAINTTFTYLNDALVKTVQTGENTVQTFNYDSMGRKSSEIDGNGNTTSYQYDSLGRIKKTIYPDNSSVTNQYTLNRSGVNTFQQTDERGNRTKYTYDELGRVSFVTDLYNNTQLMKYTYDALGRVITATDANKNQYVFTYDKHGRKLTAAVKNQSGTTVYQEKYTYDDVYDSTTSKMITSIGGTSSGAVKTAVYTDKYGQVVKVSNNESDSADVTTYKYDYLGNKTEEKSAMDAQRNRSYTNQYGETTTTANGTVQTVKNTLGYITSTKLDMIGNQKEVVDPNGHNICYLYDDMGRVQSEIRKIDGQDTNTSYIYDNNGNVTQESRKVSVDITNNTYYQYDSRNRLIKAWNDENQLTAYTYDNAGNMLTMTVGANDGSGETKQMRYEYDHRNRLTKVTDAMGQSETYTYDNNGNVLTKTDRNGTIFTSTYDGFNRLTQQIAKNPALGEEKHLNYAYTAANLLKSVTDSTAGTSVTYTYDAKGRRTKEVQNFGSDNSGEIAYGYLLNDQPSLLTVKENGVGKLSQSFEYDDLDRLKSITDASNSSILASYTYDNAGNLTQTTRANGVNTAYTYNESNLITQVTNAKGATTLSSYGYQYYLNGAQSQVSDNLGRTQNYTYDRAGRLVKEQDTDESNAAIRNFTYDVYGNRTSMVADGTGTNYTYDKNNRLIKQETDGATLEYNYDNNGNLYSKLRSEIAESTGETERVELSQTSPYAEFYTYNVLGQLVDYTGNEAVSYTYGADGKRASKTVNGSTTRFLWNGDNLAYESNGTKYYCGNGLTAIAPQGSADKNYYLYDGHGSVTQLIDTSGATIADYRYDAFGNQLQTEQSAVYNPFRYSGEYTDLCSGLIYLRNRYYDPSIGRFISEDPVKDGLNWYVYCSNDPVNMVDPMGTIPTPEEAAAMADHVYYWNKDSDQKDRTVAGWRMIYDYQGRESMKMGVYIPDGDDWRNPSEYAVVFRGSIVKLDQETLSVWGNNIEAAFSENSADMWDAMNYGLGFVKAHQGKEITFVGHSKGGGEAIAAAAYTDKNAITFNAANFSFRNYVRDGGRGEITNYYVDGEILSGLIDRASVGMPIMLDSYYNADIKWYDLLTVRDGKELYAAYQNHGMDAVIGALNRRK